GPRYVHNEGSHDNPNFGAQSHGFGTRCLRFVRCLTTRDARLASRCRPLYGTGLVTRRILTKGFRPVSSSLPKLLGARTFRECGGKLPGRSCQVRETTPLFSIPMNCLDNRRCTMN